MEIRLVEITDDNRKKLLEMAIAGYIGEKCRYCGYVYESVEDIDARGVVFAGRAMFACKACFDTCASLTTDEAELSAPSNPSDVAQNANPLT